MTDILTGLSTEEAEKRLLQYGKNELTAEKKESFFKKTLHIIAEPMFLLLILAAVIYFILGEPRDGAIMLVFVLGIISIDVIQEWKTDKTLNALKDLSAPHSKVLRDGRETVIASDLLVPGDLMLISEGVKIPADGKIVKANDLCVDESSLTGESAGVWKTVSSGNQSTGYWRQDYCYAGTLVTQGNATVLVEKTGALTEYGKIGVNVAAAKDETTPLQRQTGSLVKLSAGIAAVLFAVVGAVTYFNLPDHLPKDRLIESVLSGITLAMAMIPEEFPVILTVFLSMGAWRLARKKSLIRRLPSVETLGAVSVLCVDKTGTITLNQMTVQEVWAAGGDSETLCETMGLGCETDAYDPMEKAMLSYCESSGVPKEHLFGGQLITEYPFTNETKMMGHVWRHDGELIIAAKGSPEKILTVCRISEAERLEAAEKAAELSGKGLRVIAVASQKLINEADIPSSLNNCQLSLLGLVGLADPPRDTVKDDIRRCTNAGVRVVMITGDNGITASSIAKQVGIPNSDSILTGDELSAMSDDEMKERVKKVSIFSRVIPEHKMRIVKALQQNGEIVAMTGDGVNDAPALKSADIGIAMGERGSEVSREAADLILMDDNFSTIVDTIRDGRRIYDNIKKAVGYVFSIHIPIALASLLAPILKISPAGLLLLPLHVVLLELVIDPTCSIVLERQPAEKDILARPPRDPKETLLNLPSLIKSVIQGLFIFAASFGTYYYMLSSTGNAERSRSMGIAIIILANLFLVLVNCSQREFAFQTARLLLRDKVMWVVQIVTVAGLLFILYSPANGFLKLSPLSLQELISTVIIAAVSVFWYELVKLFHRTKKRP